MIRYSIILGYCIILCNLYLPCPFTWLFCSYDPVSGKVNISCFFSSFLRCKWNEILIYRILACLTSILMWNWLILCVCIFFEIVLRSTWQGRFISHKIVSDQQGKMKTNFIGAIILCGKYGLYFNFVLKSCKCVKIHSLHIQCITILKCFIVHLLLHKQ